MDFRSQSVFATVKTATNWKTTRDGENPQKAILTGVGLSIGDITFAVRRQLVAISTSGPFPNHRKAL